MNSFKRKYLKALTLAGSLLVSAVIVSACGGGGGGSSQSAGVGGTGVRGYVQGKVTGFGSIYVNGDKFDTDASKFLVDGNPAATQGDLAIGMVVSLEVEAEDGVYTGKALKVIYDDEIEGPVDAAPVVLGGGQKQFDVFDQSIIIDDTGTLFEDTSFADIAANDVVEISGFRTSPTEITATFVKKTGVLVLGATEVELRGTIANLGGSPASFKINGITITTDTMTDIDVPNGVLSNGLYVEVGGFILTATSVHAEEIEHEDEGFDVDVDGVSLEGIISNFSSISDFEINGQAIDASGAELEPANAAMLIADGVEVEVEGDIVGGVLIAEELEIEESDAELESFVGQVNVVGKWFSVRYPTAVPGSIVVRTDGKTVFEDEAGLNPVENMTIDDLNKTTDYVRVEGREVNDEVVASTVKRIDVEDACKLQGQVDVHDPGISITILGVVYQVDVATSYDPSNAFVAGDIVEIEDEADPRPADPLPADGIADLVEVD
ncbi:MAG: hypothetical protein GY815_05565 [Gammaproteobacteria bacterium]|nr:hypothetical protein [Gammaproteobacteria bacterium]